MYKIILLSFLLLFLGCSEATAQAVKNPSGAEFTSSVDHLVITSYEIGWFLIGAPEPVSMVNIGKPAPDGSNRCVVQINVMPLAFNDYVAKIRAYAGTLVSDWSEASNIFQRVPGPPSKLVVK